MDTSVFYDIFQSFKKWRILAKDGVSSECISIFLFGCKHLFTAFLYSNRRIRLTCLRPCCQPNSDHMIIHLGGYNCSVCTYSHALSCVRVIAHCQL